MSENQKLREAFEAYITDNGKWPNAILKAPGGQYLLLRTSVAWQDWMACAEALAPAPAQEIDKSVADAEIKSMYVESQGSDKGWLGIEGSYFIGGVVAARKQKAALAPAQLTDEERADMACAVAAICTGASSRTVAATAIEWTERALRAKGGKHV